MALWTNIRANMSSAIRASFPSVQMSGYLGADGDAPWFEIDFPAEGISLDTTYGRGTDEVELIIRGCVPLGDVVETQQALDAWLEPNSGVREAILGMSKPSGLDDLRVTRINAFRRISVAEKPNVTAMCHEWFVSLLLSY